VDLDGTLIRSDSLIESALSVVKVAPAQLFKLPKQLKAGRAQLKAHLAAHAQLDPARYPYQAALLAYLRQQRQSGRQIVLVTAAHQTIAQAIADHLGLFDTVMASDGSVNLKGETKAAKLVERFGAGGFDYAGDSMADLPVWRQARHAILVNPQRGVAAAASQVASISHTFSDRPTGIGSYLKAMRPHHWMKNLLVFVPLIAAHQITDPAAFGQLLIAFIAFGLTASSVYLLNDLLDLGSDRSHPVKRLRPLAAGDLPILHACALIPVLLLAALLVAALLPERFMGLLTTYYLCTLAYSVRLKRVMMVDVLLLAWLYVLRVVAGTAAIGITLSFWLFAFAMFMFLSLALVKRHAELRRFEQAGLPVPSGRDYRIDDLGILSDLGTASGFMAVLVLALYIHSPDVTHLYRQPEALWMLCPLGIYWISRVWVRASRGQMDDDPLLFALTDRASYWVAGIALAIIIYAS